MTLTDAQTRLAAALASYDKAQTGDTGGVSSASTSERSASFRGLDELRSDVEYWQRVVNQLSAKAAGVSNPAIKIARWN